MSLVLFQIPNNTCSTTDSCSKRCANQHHNCIFPNALNHWFVKFALDFLGTCLVMVGLVCDEYEPPHVPNKQNPSVIDMIEDVTAPSTPTIDVPSPTPNPSYDPDCEPEPTTPPTKKPSKKEPKKGSTKEPKKGKGKGGADCDDDGLPRISTKPGRTLIDDSLLKKMYDLFSSADIEADGGLTEKEFKESRATERLKEILVPLGKLNLHHLKKYDYIKKVEVDEIEADELFFWLDRSTVRGTAKEPTVTIRELLRLIEKTTENPALWTVQRKLYRMFNAADQDGDHKLSPVEFAANVNVAELKGILMDLESLTLRTVLEADKMITPTKLFALLDLNQDAKLSAQEFLELIKDKQSLFA